MQLKMEMEMDTDTDSDMAAASASAQKNKMKGCPPLVTVFKADILTLSPLNVYAPQL